MIKLGIIIVLYNPNITQLQKSLDVLLPQVTECCIVDNSMSTLDYQFPEKVHYNFLGTNTGIAHAQNVGIEYLTHKGCSHILFSDQDSVSSENVVEKLFRTYCSLKEYGYNVGVVGSTAINRNTGVIYPVKARKLSVIPAEKLGVVQDVIEYDSVRSSVSIISVEDLKRVGLFEEKLFIDGVDNEWCWRAKDKYDLRSYVAQDAIIYHQLGEGDKKLLNKSISLSSDFRLYYMYRNYIWLSKRHYVPFSWKSKNFLKYLVKLFYYPIMMPEHKLYLTRIMKGIYHGFAK